MEQRLRIAGRRNLAKTIDRLCTAGTDAPQYVLERSRVHGR
jgi:hypothetical protein